MSQPYHLIVFGATSFVGQILTRYLWQRHGLHGELRWALAGRSQAKLEQVRASLGAGAEELPLLLADAADDSQLRALCVQTRVIVSTVGPYALYGSPLVRACAETGTDYCDLTGEVQWIARMLSRHEGAAKQSGARIVNCCGFDSVPSDLGVHFLQQQSRQRFGLPSRRIRLRVQSMRGGVSGGTVASMLNVVQEALQDSAVRKLLGNPYALCPGMSGVRQPDVRLPEYEDDVHSWVAPFVMSGINTRVVHRSALLDGDYGPDFQYDEAVLTGDGITGALKAAAISGGLAGFLAGAALPPTRALLERFVVPKPGEGPSPRAQERGNYDIRLLGETADGRRVRVKVTGDRDPGYGSTAKILGEAAVCLALDTDKQRYAGGFWTPATLLGDRFVERLCAHAGLTFEVLE